VTCRFSVGVAGFEPAASSSRSQVAVRAACAAACLTWERPSVSVYWRPPLAVAVVTHLVTRLRKASAWPPGCKLSARLCSGQTAPHTAHTWRSAH